MLFEIMGQWFTSSTSLQVQDKSIDLQRAVAMNRQISASYDNLQNQLATLEKRDNAIVYATIELLSHISQNIGSQLESSALANFLRQIVPFLPSTKVSHLTSMSSFPSLHPS